MRKICKSCGQLLDEMEFDMRYPAIRVRKETCKKCERRQRNLWWLRELIKQEARKNRRPGASL